jgi:hypothetical protein
MGQTPPQKPVVARQRPKTVAGKRLTRAEIRQGIATLDDAWYAKPKTRAECANEIRPCPFVSCRHHLYLDVRDETQSIKLNFPHLEVWELEDSCSLDVAEQGGLDLREIAELMNVSHQRIHQIGIAGMERLRSSGVGDDLERVFGTEAKFREEGEL